MTSDTTLKDRRTRSVRPRHATVLAVWSASGAVDREPVVLERGTTVVGRAAGADIVLDGDPRVSRRHAELRTGADGAVRLVDVSSTGTMVNGKPVTDAPLADGDVVRVGDSLFVFRLEPERIDDHPIDGWLGVAPATRAMRGLLHSIARTPATVLLVGETGTGKEVAARAIHAHSRQRGPFVPVNCSAIPEQIAESQLFGHIAGAYTGAKGDATGYFRAAEGGTLFLDEIGEMPLAIQPKLLRALEERAVTPVGLTRAIPCAVRVVAATNRDLREAVGHGSFRQDLHARIAELVVDLPPLRQRREDIVPILLDALGPGARPLTADLVEALLLHSWPSNVRELLKIASHLRIRGGQNEVYDVDLIAGRFEAPATGDRAAPDPVAAGAARAPDREKLRALLRRHGGVIADVAREMRRSRKQVYRWLRQHDLDPTDFRSSMPR